MTTATPTTSPSASRRWYGAAPAVVFQARPGQRHAVVDALAGTPVGQHLTQYALAATGERQYLLDGPAQVFVGGLPAEPGQRRVDVQTAELGIEDADTGGGRVQHPQQQSVAQAVHEPILNRAAHPRMSEIPRGGMRDGIRPSRAWGSS
ncbi:hypothetical protein OG478_34255 [Streptomyces phaeochromogenes]|nr:hypothetical protein OG478_34255 [Streptomyces phaeochromogenes]